jgi:hypothetical protein
LISNTPEKPTDDPIRWLLTVSGAVGLEFSIEEASSKVRSGPPLDDESDYGLPVWAGVLPLEIKSRPPIPDDKLVDGITLPDYVRRYDARLKGGAGDSSNG